MVSMDEYVKRAASIIAQREKGEKTFWKKRNKVHPFSFLEPTKKLHFGRISQYSLMPFRLSVSLILISVVALFTGCTGSANYKYHYVPGKTAVVRDGYAVAPPMAPASVRAAIEAGNRIAGLPYRYGAGHGRGIDTAYDCSGASSFVLKATGRLDSPMPSRELRHFGESGSGKWISIYARRDHVFLVVAGLRFDTGWTNRAQGPQWTTMERPASGCVIRHPEGL